MDYGILIAALKVKQCLTDLEKDILDTWNEIQKKYTDECWVYHLTVPLHKGRLYRITSNILIFLPQ